LVFVNVKSGQSEQQMDSTQEIRSEDYLMKTHALFDSTGRVAVVTGGNGGIGRSIALGLAEGGAAVTVLGRNDEKNQRVLSELKATGVPSVALKVDLTDRAAWEPALNMIEVELGGVGNLVGVQSGNNHQGVTDE
jgi:NAD(P)-dependent dehydrogenase (short-subunit alcohol dehydrogenase family)